MKQARYQKFQAYIQMVIILAIIVAINVIGQFYHERLDLTTDNRYTLSQQTIERLKNLDDIVYAKVYLGNENLPSGFQRLKESTRELLNEMKAYAGDKLEYEFINPSDIEDPKEKRERYKQLSKEGLDPVNLQIQKEGGSATQLIFPGAIFFYKNKTASLQILRNQRGRNPHKVIHNSIVGLEYGVMNTIKQLQTGKSKRVAFVTGHGELGKRETKDIRNTLSNYYDVKRLNLPEYKVGALREFDLAVIAKPREEFSELEKFKVDQFIMRGGKVLWLVESLNAEMDNLNRSGVGMSRELNLNLDDQLFNYGVRINRNLVQDLQSHVINVVRSARGNQQRQFVPWPYYPLISPKNQHPITNNLNSVWFRFANTIDTLSTENVDKKVLLKTSNNSRVMPHPVRINMQKIRQKMNKRLFRSGPQNVGVLLEGEFSSVFKNRVSPKTLQGGDYGELKTKSETTKMIVVSDGDVIRNQVSQMKDRVYELGKDRFVKKTFANKEFIMNCVDYLLDESGLMKLRAKDFSLRMLNKNKAEEEKRFWQAINMAGPIIVLIIFGLIFNFIRRQKFGRWPE